MTDVWDDALSTTNRLLDALPSQAERCALENMRSDVIMGHKVMASDAEVALRVINRFIGICSSRTPTKETP